MKLLLALVVVFACGPSKPVVPVTGSAAPTTPLAAGSASPAPSEHRTQTVTFHTDALGVDKQFVVYLPASYASSPAKHYPVFYYLHGIGGSETDWVKSGHLDAAADLLGLEAIVVMPDGDDDFYVDSPMPIDYDACIQSGRGLMDPREDHPSTCVRTRNYETYVVRDLIGYVDSHYRTIASRDGRAIAGLSMGGFGALMLAGRHPDLFAAAASHSGIASLLYRGPHPYDAAKAQTIKDSGEACRHSEGLVAWLCGIFGDSKTAFLDHDPVTLLTKLAPGQLAIYLDSGTEDDYGFDANAAYLHDQLAAKHIDSTLFLGPGKHDFAFWTAREPFSLKFLRDHTTAAK